MATGRTRSSSRRHTRRAAIRDEEATGIRALCQHTADAVAQLGRSLLTNPANDRLRDELETGRLAPDEYGRRMTQLVVQWLALLFAERRGLLAGSDPPEAGFRQDLPDPGRDLAFHMTIDDAGLFDVLRALTGAERDAGPFDFAAVAPAALGTVYESLIGRRFRLDAAGGEFELAEARSGSRKTSGSYYTPPDLVACLLDSALDPALDDAARDPDPQAALLNLRICDPACGTGNFLVPAARRVAHRLATIRTGRADPPSDAIRTALREVSVTCVHGVDLDPTAALVCRAILWLDAEIPNEIPPCLNDHIRCGDSLLDASLENAGEEIVRGCGQLAPRSGSPLHSERPTMPAGGFDVVVGNPPFVNAIEGPIDRRARQLLSQRFPELGGTADRAFAFLALATRITRPGGFVGLVQPRTVLNAPAAARLRRRLHEERPPRLVFLCDRPDLFSGASVFIALLTLGPNGDVRVARGDSPRSADWHTGRFDGDNWWAESLRLIEGRLQCAASDAVRLGDEFDVAAGMTAGDAYDVLPFVVDDRDGDAPKLVTTGLIDPGVCLWGSARCRFLKRDFAAPRIVESEQLSPSLRRRIAGSRRPKVLVAGLSRRIECFLDHEGRHMGAVSTWSITHARDDPQRLRELERALLSRSASEEFRRQLGGNALGGGNTTVTKAFLQNLRLPLPP